MSNTFNLAMADLFSPQKRSGDATLKGTASWASFFNISRTESGKKINTQSSLTISAFYSALNTVANSMALLPMVPFQDKNGIRQPLTDHSAFYLLRSEPNNLMTAFNFKFIMAVAVIMRGNAFALIVRDNSGYPSAYIFLDPDKVSVILHDGKLFYKHEQKVYTADDVVHIPGFSFDGITGKSILEHAADNLGVSLTAQTFGSDSLHDRGVSQAVVETDLKVSPDGKKAFAKSFSNALATGDKHRVAVLDEGFKYRRITLSPEEAKFIETYAAGVEDIGRWFQIPNFKLNIKGEGGYNFIVEMSNEYLQRAVMPIGEKFKQEFERKTFTLFERKEKGIYINLNYKKLLQTNPKARAQFYKDLYFMGAINANEIRELEDMNPRKGGEEYVQMSNVLNEMQLKNLLKDGTAE